MKNKSFWYTIILCTIMCIVVVAMRLFSIHDLWYETVAAVFSVVLTAIVTFLLLKGQSEGEEKRDKNIKLHERKLEIYAKFTSTMWNILSDDNIYASEIKLLRSEMFNELLFFLDDKQIYQIDNALKCLLTDKELSSDDCRKAFTKITEILRCDINNTEYIDSGENKVDAASRLWSTCSSLFDAIIASDNNNIVEIAQESETHKRVSRRCHHFAIFKFNKWQKSLFANKTNALVLCENNGDTQRTNAIKRIKLNDLVFAYQSQEQGYTGVFLAKGWVVFEKDKNGHIKEVKYEYECSDRPRVIEGAEYQSDIIKYNASDIATENNETRYSLLLVEPLWTCDRGVGKISTYRSTVSTYDQHYAWLTLARFNYMYNNHKSDCCTFEDEQISCNETKFEQLLKEESIPVAKIENGEWIN